MSIFRKNLFYLHTNCSNDDSSRLNLDDLQTCAVYLRTAARYNLYVEIQRFNDECADDPDFFIQVRKNFFKEDRIVWWVIIFMFTTTEKDIRYSKWIVFVSYLNVVASYPQNPGSNPVMSKFSWIIFKPIYKPIYTYIS